MIEGRRAVIGEAILSGLATNDRVKAERSQDHLLEELVREHSRMVYCIGYALLRSHHDAEDATQETFIRVLRYGTRLTSVDDPKGWLARIAWRVALGRSKHRGLAGEVALDDPEKPLPEVASNNAGADEALHSQQVSALVEKLIAALPAKLRDPLILSTVEEMTPSEVAATLGINEAAVRSRIFRARQALKQKLAQIATGKPR